jgi:hypothetical protein
VIVIALDRRSRLGDYGVLAPAVPPPRRSGSGHAVTARYSDRRAPVYLSIELPGRMVQGCTHSLLSL